MIYGMQRSCQHICTIEKEPAIIHRHPSVYIYIYIYIYMYIYRPMSYVTSIDAEEVRLSSMLLAIIIILGFVAQGTAHITEQCE